MIIARELTGDVKLLVVAQPTRGLDVGSIEFIHRRIIEMRDRGAAVLLVSAELDEVLTLADRIGVIYRGTLVEHRRPGRGHPRHDRPVHGQRRALLGDAPDERDAGTQPAARTRRGSSTSSAHSIELQPVLVPVYAILLALLVASVVILIVGGNPLEAYWALLRGMFGCADRIAASLGRSTPFIGAVPRGGVRVPRRPVQHRRRGSAARRCHRRGLGGHALVAGRRAGSDRDPDHRPRRRPRRRRSTAASRACSRPRPVRTR